MVMGSKFVRDFSLERLRVLILLFLSLFFVSLSTFPTKSEENITKALKELGIYKDPLLDFPIIENIEKAKEAVNSEENPTDVRLANISLNNTTTIVVEVTFGDPVNKKVYVDAFNGSILEIQPLEEKSKKNLTLLSFTLLVIVIIIVTFVISLRRKLIR